MRAEELWARAAAEREREAEARLKAEQLEVEAGAWAAGADGERRVANALQALPDGWVVLHDRLLRPGTSLTNLDHVVVGPGGVFLVDAKNWAGGLSVHDGNLWQHAGRSSAKGAELDKLAAFAGEMEMALGVPVVPVVAPAGGHAARFRAQRVRGVEVVPGNRLVKWLRRQPATTGAVSAELLSRKVAHTYPSASADDSTATPSMTTLTVPAVLNARPSETPTPARRRRATARQGRRRPSTLKAVVGFGLLVVLSQLAPRAAQVFPSSLPSVLVPHGSSPTPASSPPGLVTSRKALPVTVPAGDRQGDRRQGRRRAGTRGRCLRVVAQQAALQHGSSRRDSGDRPVCPYEALLDRFLGVEDRHGSRRGDCLAARQHLPGRVEGEHQGTTAVFSDFEVHVPGGGESQEGAGHRGGRREDRHAVG
ncbi:MAG: nuclease-related domain-containing protein [Terrabacter sp.]